MHWALRFHASQTHSDADTRRAWSSPLDDPRASQLSTFSEANNQGGQGSVFGILIKYDQIHPYIYVNLEQHCLVTPSSLNFWVLPVFVVLVLLSEEHPTVICVTRKSPCLFNLNIWPSQAAHGSADAFPARWHLCATTHGLQFRVIPDSGVTGSSWNAERSEHQCCSWSLTTACIHCR